MSAEQVPGDEDPPDPRKKPEPDRLRIHKLDAAAEAHAAEVPGFEDEGPPAADRILNSVVSFVRQIPAHAHIGEELNMIIAAERERIDPMEKLQRVIRVLDEEPGGNESFLVDLVEAAHGKPRYIREGIDLILQHAVHETGKDDEVLKEQHGAFGSLLTWSYAFNAIRQRVQAHVEQHEKGAMHNDCRKFVQRGYEDYFYAQVLQDYKAMAQDKHPAYALLKAATDPFVRDHSLPGIRPRSQQAENLLLRTNVEQGIERWLHKELQDHVQHDVAACVARERTRTVFRQDAKEPEEVGVHVNCAGLFSYAREKLGKYAHDHPADKEAATLLDYSRRVFQDEKRDQVRKRG